MQIANLILFIFTFYNRLIRVEFIEMITNILGIHEVLLP